MKRTFAILLSAAMVLTAFPVVAGAATPRATRASISFNNATQNAGEIAGNATKDGKPLVGYKVQLRNTDTKALVGNMKTGAGGAFKFTGLPVGNYVVETVDDKGDIIATSATIGLAAGAMVAANVGVATSAAVAGAAAAGTGLAASTIIITTGAVLAGTGLAVVAVNNNASASGG